MEQENKHEENAEQPRPAKPKRDKRRIKEIISFVCVGIAVVCVIVLAVITWM